MVNKRLSLTRDQLASFLQDFEQVKQFERLFATTDANVISIDDVNIAAGNAGESANDALAQIIDLSETLNLAPPGNLGTVTSVAASGGTTGITFSGSPITTSGTLTLGGTLAVTNGGTGQTIYTNGQLLIGNTTGNTLTPATLTAGTNISITNGSGAITINATDTFVGTVTSVSVVSANGFAGTVANPTTTPAITLSTSVNGIIKGNGTALSAAVAATDYVAPSAYASANGLTMSTSRLLGRTTASTGAAEEISVAGGLTLSGGVLTGASGTVTSVTGTSPVVSSGGTTPAISMPAATTSVNGYLTSTDWTTFNNKGSGTVTSVSGTGTVNGITLTGTVTSSGSLTLGGTLSGVSLTTQVSGTLPIANGGTNGTSAPTAGAVPYGTGTAYAFTAAGTSGQVLTSAGAGVPTWTTPTTGTVTSVTGTAPIVSSGGATPAISMAAATASVNGYLTSTDWTTFNNKGSGTVTSVGGTGTVNGITLTGTVTTSGNLTLGGTLSGVSLTSQVTGTLPVANGGTGTATAFTVGSVVFAGTSGVYTQDNANLFWNDTSNRMGIGTASPASKLDVAGTITVSAAAGNFTLDTSGSAVSVANGGTVNFSNASGMLLVNSHTNGFASIYLMGGGNVSVPGAQTYAGGAVGAVTYNAGINGYTWTNNSGGTVTVGFMFFRTRAAA